jgi:hypothetical protein
MLALRLNPFKFEDDLRKSTNADLMNVDSNKCSYIFDNDTFSSSSDSDFSIIHLNTRSFNKNADVVNIFLSNIDHTFSVICISETWFYDDMSNVLNIKGYELVNAPRRDGRRGGGSAIYVHNSLTYRVREDLTLITDPPVGNDNDHSQSVFVEIVNDTSKNGLVGNIYRDRRTDDNLFISALDQCLNKILIEKKQCYLSGDFNFDLLQHEKVNTINEFLNTFFNYSMFPLIDRPTRITPTTATLIDNIFTNVLTHDIKSGVCVYDITDHYPVFQITSSMSHKINNHLVARRSINENRILRFHYHISLIDWSFVTDLTSSDTAYNAFSKTFIDLYDVYFPLKYVNRSGSSAKNIPRKPWITPVILKSINRKQRLYKKSIGHPSITNKKNYITYRNTLTTLIRNSKKSYYTDKLDSCKHDTKRTWNILNNILNRRNRIKPPTNFNIHGSEYTDPLDISKQFNSYFSNICINLSNNIPSSPTNFHDCLNQASSHPGILSF